MNKTKIEWVKNPDGSQGYTWNPITGCLNGCPYCYARKLANGRLKERYLANKNLSPDYLAIKKAFDTNEPFSDPFYPRSWFDRRERGLESRKPKGVFVCDMSDLFGIGIPESWTECVLETIKVCPEHRFYLLTKQPQNLIKWSPYPPNCRVGVTVTCQRDWNKMLPNITRTTSTIRYISFEPLLDRVTPLFIRGNTKPNFDWVIIGAQTPYSPKTAPKIEWVREIVEAADKVGIPVFLKNNLFELINYQSPETAFAFNKEGYYRQEMPL